MHNKTSKWINLFLLQEADTKMFANSKFLCDNIRLNRIIVVSPDTDVRVISLH